MIPATMRAVAVKGGRGPAQALEITEIPVPAPERGHILVRVRAAGVNRPDVLQRRGAYPPPPGAPETLGLEIAGEVAALGEDAPRWRIGDAVCALLPGGGYAEYAVVDARHALPIPEGLDPTQAAALPETTFTVWSNLFEIGGLKAGETALIHGATSGIGVTAIGLGKALGARVIATSRGADKAAAAKALGADVSVDSLAVDFAEAVRAEGGADVILDMVAGEFAARGVGCLKPHGRLVVIALQGGRTAEIDLEAVMRRRLTVTGSTLRPRSADEKARLAAAVEAEVWPIVAAGRFRPRIDAVFPLERAAEAHEAMESGAHVGKIVLSV